MAGTSTRQKGLEIPHIGPEAYTSVSVPTTPGSPDAEDDGQAALRLAYLVSRFPKTTETFVVRELNQVAANDSIDARLYSLFPPPRRQTIHPSAEPWLDRVQRPSLLESVRAAARWARRRPWVMLGTMALLVGGFGRRPRKLIAALGAMLVACAQAERMQSDRVEHVHAHFVGHPATAAWVIRRLTGIEYSVTAHAYELFQDREFLRRRVQDAAFVITISRFNADFLFRFCKGNTPPISVVRAGVDLAGFRYQERMLPATGPVTALAVGSLIAHKGHRLLLEALSTSDPELERVRLLIVGDGPERRDLEARIDEYGLGDRVTLLGSQPEDEVARLLEAADIFVLPSMISPTGRMEGIPVVLMEALAAGVPAVATRLSGIPELVEQGVTGILAEQGDPASLRSAILSVLGDPAGAQARARAGRARVEREFDVAASADVLIGRFLAVRPTARLRAHRRRPAFIAWSRSARSHEMAMATGATYHTIYIGRLSKRTLAPLRYALSAVSTIVFLLRNRPSVVVATNPPIFPALIAHLLSPVTGSVLVLDSHPRGFGYKGSSAGRLMAPVHAYLIRHARATLVAGDELAGVVAAAGGRPMVLHEAPPLWSIDQPPEMAARPTVLWVTVFAADEPVGTVLEAARRLPEVHFLITGDVRRCPTGLRASAPSNVTFAGFWAEEGYARLVASAQLMLVLTTESVSVPRAAFEAVESLRPLIISDFPALREQFPDATFVANTASAIAAGVTSALAQHAELVDRAGPAREAHRADWQAQLRALERILAGSDGLPSA